MHGIIFNTDQECIDLISFIDSKVKFMFKGASKTYTYFIKELNGERRLVVINPKDIEMLLKDYPTILGEFGQTLVDSVVEVDKAEWISQEEI